MLRFSINVVHDLISLIYSGCFPTWSFVLSSIFVSFSHYLFKFWWQQKLEKLQDEEQVEKPFFRKQMKIRFPERGRSGRSVVTVKGLEFGYEDEVINVFDEKELLMHQDFFFSFTRGR